MPLNLGFYSRSQSYYNKVGIAQYFRGVADFEFAVSFNPAFYLLAEMGYCFYSIVINVYQCLF